MKKIILQFLFILAALTASAQFDHQNISLLGTFSDSTVTAEPTYGIKYQAVWGWHDQLTGREYAIIGSTAGTYIVEVTNPTAPELRDYIPGRRNNCIWHEYKTYGNYLYIISDDGGNNSFQIADLSTLPDSATVVYDDTDIFVHAHTIFIDGDNMYIGSVSTNMGFHIMGLYSLSTPEHPTLIRYLDEDFSQQVISHVHDMFVRNDTIYASCGPHGLFIFIYDSISNHFIQVGALQDNVNIYNHSSVLSPDPGILYLCEEEPAGQPVKIIDVNDLSNPSLLSTFYSHVGATPHNVEVKNNSLIVAYYQDGVYVYNIADPLHPVMTGYFDTYMLNAPGSYPSPAFNGCWSTYSELPSGVLLAGDTEFGLYCLDISQTTSIASVSKEKLFIYPNPAKESILINFNSTSNDKLVTLSDLSGRIISEKISNGNSELLPVQFLSDGTYMLTVKDSQGLRSELIQVVH